MCATSEALYRRLRDLLVAVSPLEKVLEIRSSQEVLELVEGHVGKEVHQLEEEHIGNQHR